MFYRPLSLLLLLLSLGCKASDQGSEPDSARILRIARMVGDVGLNKVLVPELQKHAPQVLVLLDKNQDGLLTVSEFDDLPEMSEEEQDALIARMILLFLDKER